MFDLVLNTPFVCNANQFTDFYLIAIVTKIFFSKKAIEIWILIPTIPRNMSKLHVKKIYTKYDNICVFEKSPHENYHREKISRLEWSGVFLLFSKSMRRVFGVCIGSFFNLYITLPWYHQNGNLMKQQISETFPSCSQINLTCFLWHFGNSFSDGKNKTKWQGTWRMAAMTVTCTLILGKLM